MAPVTAAANPFSTHTTSCRVPVSEFLRIFDFLLSPKLKKTTLIEELLAPNKERQLFYVQSHLTQPSEFTLREITPHPKLYAGQGLVKH